MINHIFTKTLDTLVILLSILILGMFVPTTVALFYSAFTEVTFTDSICNWLYITISIIGVIIAAIYINEDVIN